MKEEAWTANPGPTRTVVDQARNPLTIDARLQAPQKNMSQIYWRERVKANEQLGDRGLDDVGAGFTIPNNLLQSVLINEVLPGEGRIVAFAAPWAIEFLDQNSTQIGIDGTFAVILKLNT
jgi:hypothetical protein